MKQGTTNNVGLSQTSGEPVGSLPSRSGGSRLLRRTFLIALILISGGLISSGAIALFFRYQESVESIGALQREMAKGAAFKIQAFVRDIEKTLRAATQTPEIVTAGLTDAYRFQLIKLLRIAPALTTVTALDANGHEQLKVSRVQMVQAQTLLDRSAEEAITQALQGPTFFSAVYFVRQSEPYMQIAIPIERFAGDIVGALVADVNLKYIWEVMSRIHVGETGYAYVISRQGDLIAHPDMSLVLQKQSLKELGQVQAAQLAAWNRTLEQRVQEWVTELERMGRLKRFFSPQVSELVVSSGGERLLQSHLQEVTVVFCDLRGFTAFSETTQPEDVMAVLRQYHRAMGTLIFQFEGTLERFTGDGMMVFFNDPLPCPDPSARAVRMALDMREHMSKRIDMWRHRGYQLHFGIGIAHGHATLGMIGFEGRVDYAAIGPVTNLAARLCDHAEGGQILISQAVYKAVADQIEAEPAGALNLKGLAEPVLAFNVL